MPLKFKQALTEIQKSVDSLVNSTTAKTARIGLAFSGVKDMVSTAFAAIDGTVQKAFDFVAPAAADSARGTGIDGPDGQRG